MKHALVTGSPGLIGFQIVDLLVREGWYLRALDNLESLAQARATPAAAN
jgi:NAD(P)-dependent dehydrogenase (short-subunit alcohol dehydrogenase family)